MKGVAAAEGWGSHARQCARARQRLGMATLELRNAHVLRWVPDCRWAGDMVASIEWLGDECVLHCDLRGNIQRVSRHAPAADQVGASACHARSPP